MVPLQDKLHVLVLKLFVLGGYRWIWSAMQQPTVNNWGFSVDWQTEAHGH